MDSLTSDEQLFCRDLSNDVISQSLLGGKLTNCHKQKGYNGRFSWNQDFEQLLLKPFFQK